MATPLTARQMAKRMKFSVVGLPHYTIWHLYEPSVDDIRHMEEMEKERKAKEAEEKAKKEREDKIHQTFDTKSSDWEKEKAEVQDLVQKAKNDEKARADKEKEDKKEDKKENAPADKKAETKQETKQETKDETKPEKKEG
jgi:mannan polymerase II complex ANP1 subunit